MRILVIGAGVIGSNIAVNFFKAGKDVTILARGQWYEKMKIRGLRIKSKFQFGTRVYEVPVINKLEPDDEYDVIFVSLKYTQIDSVIDVLNANVSKNIVFNGNNIRAEEFTKNFPDKNVMFSFAIAAGHKEENRINSVDFSKIVIGDVNGNDNSEFIDDIFEGTRYKVTYESKMGEYLLCHACFVVPVSFACYYSGGNLREIKNENSLFIKVIKSTIECYTALEKTGHEIVPRTEYRTKEYYDSVYKLLKLMAGTSIGQACVTDHAMCAVDEMSVLAEGLQEIIDEAGIKSPCFDALKVSMEKYL